MVGVRDVKGSLHMNEGWSLGLIFCMESDKIQLLNLF
jgi:hypothetical protein